MLMFTSCWSFQCLDHYIGATMLNLCIYIKCMALMAVKPLSLFGAEFEKTQGSCCCSRLSWVSQMLYPHMEQLCCCACSSCSCFYKGPVWVVTIFRSFFEVFVLFLSRLCTCRRIHGLVVKETAACLKINTDCYEWVSFSSCLMCIA